MGRRRWPRRLHYSIEIIDRGAIEGAEEDEDEERHQSTVLTKQTGGDDDGWLSMSAV